MTDYTKFVIWKWLEMIKEIFSLGTKYGCKGFRVLMDRA